MANTDDYTALKNGISWSAFERFAVQGLQFIVFVFMARALSPTDYGLVGMLTFFIVISQLIAEGGLPQAIIRKLNRDETDLSTAFFVNVTGGILLYLILFISAPAISKFYEEPQLTALLRVMALSIPIQSSLVVHRAILTSKLDFKTQARSTFVGALSSGLIGIYMAYCGYGVWALVGLQLTNQIVTSITLWIVTEWHPTRRFSLNSFKSLYGFGYKLLVSNVFDSVYTSIYTLTMGKVFSAYALGCYTNARQLGSISSENLTRIINRAAFPMFCSYQDDKQKLHDMIANYLKLTFFFIAPLMIGISSLSQSMTIALIGSQWLYTARLLRIICVYFLFFPLNSINFMILEINGKGTTYLKLKAINIAVGLGLLMILIPFGLSAVCLGMGACGFISFAINAHISGKSINLGFTRQLKLLLPTLISALVMGATVYGIQFLVKGEWLQVCLGIATGILIYGGLSMAFQTDLCSVILKLLRKPGIPTNVES